MTIYSQNFFAVTGGPGVGKSTLLNELSRVGFKCMPEVAREIIREQVARGGNALPWANKSAFAAEMLIRSIESERRMRQHPSDLVLFDRGIPDILSYVRLENLEPPSGLSQAIEEFRYAKDVFFLPPWNAIYVTDSERKQDYAEAVRTDAFMRVAYAECGYEIVDVPRLSPIERADFVRECLKTNECRTK
jgi:predicted ATPase